MNEAFSLDRRAILKGVATGAVAGAGALAPLSAALAQGATGSKLYILGTQAIPSDADLDGALAAPNAVVLHILRDDRRVGGAVVTINRDTQANSLDLLFIAVGNHGQGLGKAAWSAIEAMFPDTRGWETVTPYFERRNIHFYVNVCGFHIVEYYHERNPDPHTPSPTGLPDDSDMFRFVKEMR